MIVAKLCFFSYEILHALIQNDLNGYFSEQILKVKFLLDLIKLSK